MIVEQKPDPVKYSVINALRRLGLGICTVISEFGPFEMQISKKLIHSLRKLPSIPILTANTTPVELSAYITAYLGSLIKLKSTFILVRTFTDETICIRKCKNSIMPVNVKELPVGLAESLVTCGGDECLYSLEK